MSRMGIDIGGTKVAVRIEAERRLAYETEFRWPDSGDARRDLAELRDCLVGVQREWGLPVEDAGVAMPASLDPLGRVVAWPSRPWWVGLDFRATLRELLPSTAVRVADDGDLAALAEAGAVGLADVVYIGVGTGVGGGVVLGGRPVPEPGRGSAEIGHMVIDRTGTRCDCGRMGCLQALASGPATLRRAARSRGASVDFEDLREGLRSGAPWASGAVDETCEAVAVGLVSLCEVVRPSVVVIGGGFAAAVPGFVDIVALKAGALARLGHPVPPVEAAALGGLSSLYGALLLAGLPPAGEGLG